MSRQTDQHFFLFPFFWRGNIDQNGSKEYINPEVLSFPAATIQYAMLATQERIFYPTRLMDKMRMKMTSPLTFRIAERLLLWHCAFILVISMCHIFI